METERLKIFNNRDNESLLPSGDQRFRIGYVDEVNGAGAAEAAAYVPTRHELIQLVKYWYGRVLDDDWSFFIYAQTGSSEVRLRAFAWNRIARATAAIGKKAVDQAIKEVLGEFKATVKDTRLWNIFENGTAEQWNAVSDETHREWCERDAAKYLNCQNQRFPAGVTRHLPSTELAVAPRFS